MTLKNIPKPKNYSKLVLYAINYIIPSNLGYGYHYRKYTERIFFPIIRDKIRNLEITESDEIIVYLPTYSPLKLIELILNIRDILINNIIT